MTLKIALARTIVGTAIQTAAAVISI